MAFIDGYEHDVFVSYSHADNESIYDDDPDGWVTKFHRTLLSCLKRLDRDKTMIWRDQRLRGNDVFEEVLENSFRKAAVLVSILTPNYVKSEWCMRELRGFCPSSPAPPQVGSKSRLFKVQPWHLPLEKHPPEMGKLLGYKFYELKPDTQKEEAFRRTSQQDPDQRYWDAINNLARDINNVLDAMKAAPHGDASQTPVTVGLPADAPAVYLANVTDDLLGSREQVRRSLEQAGLRVLPEALLPLGAAEYAEAVSAEVRRAKLSVHMLGSYYGRSPRDGEYSYSRLQYDAACKLMGQGGPPVLAWLKKGSEEQAEPLQREFIADLERGSEAAGAGDTGACVELFQVGLEELKESILARVRPPEPDPSDNPFFYISCLPDDSEKAQRFLTCLRHSNYEGVVSPAQGAGDESLLRKHHRANLRRCDVFVTMYGRAPEAWVSEKVLEAREVAISRKKKRMTLTVFSTPGEKQLNVWVRNLRLWKAGEDFGCEEVKRCLQDIRS